ncbi:LOW QUALITY PROTEIN: FSO1-like protein [Colletotrichum tofieldiae]|nr:LOW QUALITY PROTEIN: FSO1-like protein [Colletotrichum tofieldiae]
MERSRGVPDAELFLHKPAEEDCDSPTVEPLRIFKPQSPNPSNDRFKYPAPPSASGSSSFITKPTFPLPPGASSSAAPLPYPDEEDLRPGKPTKPTITAPKRFGSDYNDTTPRLNASPVETKSPTLAERRGTGPRPLGATSPQSPVGDDGGLFAKPLTAPQPQRPAASTTNYPSYTKKPYYPPPAGASGSTPPAQSQHQSRPPQSSDHLDMPGQNSVNRFASTASTSTTRASRGSPPPPETPIVEPGVIPGGGIEARIWYLGHGDLDQPAGATSTERRGLTEVGPVWRGTAPSATVDADGEPREPASWAADGVSGDEPGDQPYAAHVQSPPQQAANQGDQPALQVSVLEQDYQRLGLNDPPPAYSSVTPASNPSYPAEKQRPAQQRADSTPSVTTSAAQSPPKKPATVGPAAAGLASPSLQGHPAFANDPRPEQNGQPSTTQNAPVAQTVQAPPSFQGAGPSSPPPLPEGWIAHLDQNSGQYYYIHLASQATQWEFPKGPNPIQHEATPLSPTASTYGNPLASPMFGKQSLGSPMFPPQTPGYAESIMSVAASQTPTTAGFSGPPPSAGVDMYRIQPTNGVYFGPYLRYCNMDFEKGSWLGSIMIVTDAPQPPTIHIHPSNDLSPNPRQLTPHNIFTHQRWTFYKYDIDLPMSENGTERWTYAVTSHLGCTRYEFVIAGRHEIGWRFIAHSNNDFAASTSQAERSKLGGVGFMWKDVLQKNVDCGGFHVQLGLGDQIYGDRLWKEVPLLKQWLAMSGRDNRKNAQWTARHEEDVSHAYFHYYTSHFDQPYLREAFAQIPHVLQIDDHDIFDGYGSYPEYMQGSQMFKNVGRIAVEMYLLFQHHTTVEILRNVSNDTDLFTITGQGWHFVKYLGPAVVVVGPDCRSERNQSRVMAGPTYQGIFPKVATLPPSVQHCIWMVSVPLVYPRLEAVESLAGAVATGKKVVNTSYNLLGKVTSSVAGVVGGKDVVAQGFTQVKKAVGKSGLMGNVLNQFGEIDIAEILKDMWTHDSKDLERTYLIRTLQGISQQKGIRMTFLSGDVNCAGAGLVHDPTHPSDHKTIPTTRSRTPRRT